jgi:hypothetical protein
MGVIFCIKVMQVVSDILWNLNKQQLKNWYSEKMTANGMDMPSNTYVQVTLSQLKPGTLDVMMVEVKVKLASLKRTDK